MEPILTWISTDAIVGALTQPDKAIKCMAAIDGRRCGEPHLLHLQKNAKLLLSEFQHNLSQMSEDLLKDVLRYFLCELHQSNEYLRQCVAMWFAGQDGSENRQFRVPDTDSEDDESSIDYSLPYDSPELLSHTQSADSGRRKLPPTHESSLGPSQRDRSPLPQAAVGTEKGIIEISDSEESLAHADFHNQRPPVPQTRSDPGPIHKEDSDVSNESLPHTINNTIIPSLHRHTEALFGEGPTTPDNRFDHRGQVHFGTSSNPELDLSKPYQAQASVLTGSTSPNGASRPGKKRQYGLGRRAVSDQQPSRTSDSRQLLNSTGSPLPKGRNNKTGLDKSQLPSLRPYDLPTSETTATHPTPGLAEQDTTMSDTAMRDTSAPETSKEKIPLTALEVDDKLRERIKKKLLKKESKMGKVYIFRDTEPTRNHQLKIGFTTQTITARQKKIEHRCHTKLYPIYYSYSFNNYGRAEGLVHLDLANLCRPFSCKDTLHKEWFEVSEDMAVLTVERWVDFMRQDPYESNGELKSVWRDRLNTMEAPSLNPPENPLDHDLRWARWKFVEPPSWPVKWVNALSHCIEHPFWSFLWEFSWQMGCVISWAILFVVFCNQLTCWATFGVMGCFCFSVSVHSSRKKGV